MMISFMLTAKLYHTGLSVSSFFRAVWETIGGQHTGQAGSKGKKWIPVLNGGLKKGKTSSANKQKRFLWSRVRESNPPGQLGKLE